VGAKALPRSGRKAAGGGLALAAALAAWACASLAPGGSGAAAAGAAAADAAPSAVSPDGARSAVNSGAARSAINSGAARSAARTAASGPAAWVEPRIGTAGGGNTFPGAVLPFGMVQWSPETTRGDATRVAAPGGYAYDAARVRGFSLTHLSGTGCRGASGDVPFLPYAGEVKSSPQADVEDRTFVDRFAHANETAAAGAYQVRLESGILVQLTATRRTGAARFSFPAGSPAAVLMRAASSEVGSSDAQVEVDPANRTVSGAVTSGNFCGYLGDIDRRSYYTLYFVAVFDRPFAAAGTWQDGDLRPGILAARGGTSWDPAGAPVAGRGSGAYVTFAGVHDGGVNVRVGISYVSAANAAANLAAENPPPGAPFETLRDRARVAWDEALGRIEVGGGTAAERTTFYTALYHSLLHPNLFSDVNGEYAGPDGRVHRVGGLQHEQFANFSGWDVYRSQLQLVALLEPRVAGDIAQSLLNQAEQNGGEWDRWTHNSGATHVMEGDPSPAAVAGILAFGGDGFDVRAAFASLARAATVPTAHDLSRAGCEVECAGQRPSLDRWLEIHYIPADGNAWGGAGETLEDAAADFSLAQIAGRLGDRAACESFRARSGYWRNVFNPRAAPGGGYVQDRNRDGTWPPLDPASDAGFAEGSSAQYTWMVPFDARGLIEALGGAPAANLRLDAFFHNPDGSWALTRLGGLHAELDNEPSIGAPWLYLFTGRPYRTQETVRQALNGLWHAAPDGIPGNDDLGEMSSWYVWSAMGLYPGLPGRAELLLASPLFPRVVIRRAAGPTITIAAPAATAGAPYVHALRVNGKAVTRPWLPEAFVARGGRLDFTLSTAPETTWGAGAADAPPSSPPCGN
jgi:predicted alpha-1,2-mannosidase